MESRKVLIVEGELTEKNCKNKAIEKFSKWDVVPYDEQDGWVILYCQNSLLDLAEYHRDEARKSAEFFKKTGNDFFNQTIELKAKITELEKELSQAKKIDQPLPTPMTDQDLLKIVKSVNPHTRTPLKDLRVIAEAINDGTIIPGELTEMVKRYKREAEASSQTAIEWNQRYEDLRNKTVGKKSGY